MQTKGLIEMAGQVPTTEMMQKFGYSQGCV
jgi:hypothetical protein